MDPILAARAEQQHGVFTTADATACSVPANALRALVTAGHVVRVCPRGYVEARAWRDARKPEERHALAALAVTRSFDGRVAASHHSAATLHGLPFWEVQTDVLHVACVSGRSSRTRRALRIHESYPADALTDIDGVPVVIPAVAVIGTAMVDGVHAGVAVADAALHHKLTTPEELEHWLVRLSRRPGLVRARRAVALAEPLTESVGETRTRLLLQSIPGLPAITPQYSFKDARDREWARADFLVGDRLVVEFDGLQKYRVDEAQNAKEAAEILAAEKQREDRLRRLHYVIVRLVWAELSDPIEVAARIREGLKQVAALARAA
jgi:hypothetical protein